MPPEVKDQKATASEGVKPPPAEGQPQDDKDKTVPYERFKEVNDKVKSLEDQMKSFTSQAETEREYVEFAQGILKDAALMDKINKHYDNPSTPATPAEPDIEIDPYDPKQMKSFITQVIQKELSGFLKKSVEPLKQTVNTQQYMSEVQDADKKYGHVGFDWSSKDQRSKILKLQKEVPGLTVSEAFKLIQFDEIHNEREQSEATKRAGVEGRSRSSGIDEFDPDSVELDAEQRRIARAQGLSDEEYKKFFVEHVNSKRARRVNQ